MKITSLTVDDYKRVRHVQITPDADSHLILIGGKNRQGKSSTLDALSAALGGAKAIATDPVRKPRKGWADATGAHIRVELDAGALIVERSVDIGGATQLIVRDADGPVRRPQELLDKLVGARFLDPMAFTRMRPSDQRAALMKVIPGADEIAKLDERRDRAFKQRTDVGRDLNMARGELSRRPAPAELPEPIDVAALVAESKAFADQQRAGDGIGNAAGQLAARAKRAREEADHAAIQVAELERELIQARELAGRTTAAAAAVDAELGAAQQGLADAAEAWRASEPRRIELDQLIASAGERNRHRAEIEAGNRRREETETTVKRLAADVDRLTGTIEGVDARKAELLAAAALPVEGIELADDGIRIAGVPFSQAAASEQIRIALALAIAGSPGLDDVWVKDGALLDDDSLALIAEHAAAAGKRVWVERVGTRDPGVIVIHDGQIAAEP